MSRLISGPHSEVKYTDIENLRRYPNVFQQGNHIVCLEQIEGQNFRACFQDNRLFVGSRMRWLKEADNIWWKSAFKVGLPEILPKYPDKIFFGESFGYVDGMNYGRRVGEFDLYFFDVYDIKKGCYLDFDNMFSLLTAEGLEIAQCFTEVVGRAIIVLQSWLKNPVQFIRRVNFKEREK